MLRAGGWRAAAVAALGVTLFAALVAACGDDDTAEESSGGQDVESTTTSEGTTTTLSPEDEVLQAYEAAGEALFAAYDPPDPEHPDLLAHLAGDALERAQADLAQLQSQGTSYVGTLEPHPTLTSLAGDTAVVEDCFVQTAQLIDTETRQPHGEETESVVHIESHLERVDGSWKVVREQELSEPCTPE